MIKVKLTNLYQIKYYENDELKEKASMNGLLSTFTLMDLQEQLDNDEIEVVEINEKAV